MTERTEDLFSIQELLMGCPYNDCNPRHCPLYDLRKLSVKERLTWEAYLTDEAREVIRQNHMDCVARHHYRKSVS